MKMDAPAVPRAPGPMAWMSEAVLLQPHGTALQGLRLLAFLRVFAPIASEPTLPIRQAPSSNTVQIEENR